MPASWGASGPKSSFVAKLLRPWTHRHGHHRPGRCSQGPATLCPTPQMGCSQRLQCPSTLSSVSHPTLKPSQAIQRGTHSRVGQGCSWLLGQWACRAELLGAGRKETGQMKYREQPETSGGSLMPPPASLPCMDTHLQKAKVGSMVTHTSIFTPGSPDNTKRGTHSSGGPGPLPPASSSHLPPDVISSTAVRPPGPSWLDQARSRHRYSSVPSTMNHTALRPRAPGLWGSHPGPQNAGRRHCFSREGGVPVPHHSHIPLVQGLAPPAGNSMHRSDPHG